ncbi:hypothetical protein M0R01_04950, partial [bacterium]|nr:hypothetical protein [bacterium]
MFKNINKIKNKWLKYIVKTITIIFLIILILYIGVVIYRIPAAIERQRAEKIVPQIHNQKLTMDDVMGTHLPPEPDLKLNNSTLEGIDANHNGIRDDVELAIFKLYPDSAIMRSASLQYAKALQLHLKNNITNSEIFVAVIQEDGRGYFCFNENWRKKFSKITPEMLKNYLDTIEENRKKALELGLDKNSEEYGNLIYTDKKLDAFQKIDNEESKNQELSEEHIPSLVFDIQSRKDKKEQNYKKYMTSFSSMKNSDCDI